MMNQLEGTVCTKCKKGEMHGVRGNTETVIYKCNLCGEEIPGPARILTSGPIDPRTMEFK